MLIAKFQYTGKQFLIILINANMAILSLKLLTKFAYKHMVSIFINNGVPDNDREDQTVRLREITKR